MLWLCLQTRCDFLMPMRSERTRTRFSTQLFQRLQWQNRKVPASFPTSFDPGEPAAFSLLRLQASAATHRIFFSKMDRNGPVQGFFKVAMNNVAVAKQRGYHGI